MFDFIPIPFQQNLKTSKNTYQLSEVDIYWLTEATKKQLNGSRIKSSSGLWLYTPDGIGNYKALWTRDYYYMVEYAGDLLDPKEIKLSIEYLINGQRNDGCMPDRVNFDGKAIYSPGGDSSPLADHALDNGPFMALLLCSYANQFEDSEFFLQMKATVKKGLEFVSRDESGLVFNNLINPQCVYGFTDIVKKTGNLLFSSLLFYQSSLEMEKLCRKYSLKSEKCYKVWRQKIEKNINKLYDQESGMFWAANVDCKQIDIWGSAFAVATGITNSEQTNKISKYLIENKDQLFFKGQLRHLSPNDEGWSKTFISCDTGTYQNGAFWATPLAWVIPVIAQKSLTTAKKLLNEIINDFRENGINECINMNYCKVPNYVVSATNVYTIVKSSSPNR